MNVKFRLEILFCLQDDSLRRQQWNMAKIEELLPGKDGIVRGAVIRTLDKSK